MSHDHPTTNEGAENSAEEVWSDIHSVPLEQITVLDLSSLSEMSVAAIDHSADRVIRDISPTSHKALITLPSSPSLSVEPIMDTRTMDISHSGQRLSVQRQRRWKALKSFSFSPDSFHPLHELISISDAVGVRRKEWIDLRYGTYLQSDRRYADLMHLSSPMRRRFRRMRRHHGHALSVLARGSGYVLGAFFLAVAIGSVWAVWSTVDTYQDLLAAAQTGDVHLLADESRDCRDTLVWAERFLIPAASATSTDIWYRGDVQSLMALVRGGQSLCDSAIGMTRIAADIQSVSGTGVILPTEILLSHSGTIHASRLALEKALGEYQRIGALWNADIDERIDHFRHLLERVVHYVGIFDTHLPTIALILGDERPQRILVMNQNRDEIRATGGFPGTTLDITLWRGRLESLVKKDIYEYEWRTTESRPVAPEGIRDISPTWGIRDANYFPDIDQSLRSIDDFYQKSGNDSLDTVIFVHQWVLEDLLKITGPIPLQGRNRELSAENFSRDTSVLVEARVGKESSAKDVLFLWMEEFFHALKAGSKKDIFLALDQDIERGDIMIASYYSWSDALQDQLSADVHGWKKDTGNSILPVFTSLSGNKSDRYMYRTLDVVTTSDEPCIATNAITLTSEHRWTTAEELTVRRILSEQGINDLAEQERVVRIQGKSPNRQYLRWYVPRGSMLVKSSLPVTSTEGEYGAIFSTYLTTDPGAQTSFSLTYRVPLQSCLLAPTVYHQSGLHNFTVTSR